MSGQTADSTKVSGRMDKRKEKEFSKLQRAMK